MASKTPVFSIALSAGGKSSRMGRDKGLLSFMGKPLHEYILDQLRGASDDIFLIANEQGYGQSEAPVFADKIADIGALGGIFSALSYAQHDVCLVLACDMPFISLPIIDQLLSEVSDFDVAIPQLGSGLLEPFRAIYRKTCLPIIEKAIQDGERKATGFLPAVKTAFLLAETLTQLDPNLESFLNINSPGELVEVEAIARKRSASSNLRN
jgi:molybdopterin-guanine dinucleotide biosynthesis protein A